MFRTYKGTRHIRDMYEICTAQVRDFSATGAKMTGHRCGVGIASNQLCVLCLSYRRQIRGTST